MVLGGMIFMFIKGLTTAHNGNSKPAETEFFDGKDTKDGVNILILGTDGRVGDDSTETRTDSIMVLNVGNKDHKVKLVSFMRDTLFTLMASAMSTRIRRRQITMTKSSILPIRLGSKTTTAVQTMSARCSKIILIWTLNIMRWWISRPLRQLLTPFSQMASA